MVVQTEKILILAKTYPSPSASYIETSCVAGVNSEGKMRRLFPVPFRLLEDTQRFSKWQWIHANIAKAHSDHRPESFRIDVGTLQCGSTIKPVGAWSARREWIERLPQFESFSELERWSSETRGSLALLRPRELTDLDVAAPRRTNWTEDEVAKLMRSQNQGSLLNEEQTRGELVMLNKLPRDFYYRYVCADGEVHRHKIVDWEAGQLYRRCAREYGSNCDEKFRYKLFDLMQNKEMMFLIGNQHRFQTQWLIISLIYPPRVSLTPQRCLF